MYAPFIRSQSASFQSSLLANDVFQNGSSFFSTSALCFATRSASPAKWALNSMSIAGFRPLLEVRDAHLLLHLVVGA